MNNTIKATIAFASFIFFLNIAAYAQGNVGIGITTPVNNLDVAGALAIGSGYAGVNTAPDNGALFQGNVGIGKTSASALLDVNGDAIINGLTAGRGSGNVYSNTAFGDEAFESNTSGQSNTAIGGLTLLNNSSGSDNVALGYAALYYNSTGIQNTASGTYALFSTTTGSGNTAFGKNALYNNATGSNNSALGYYADVTSPDLTNATAIGYNAKVASSNSLVLGGTGGDAVNVGIGTTAPINKLDVAGGFVVGSGYAGINTAPTNGALFQGNVGIGKTSASAILDVNGDAVINGLTAGRGSGDLLANVAFGSLALLSNTSGNNNAGIGSEALKLNDTGNNNTAVGSLTLNHNTSGSDNIAIVLNALSNSNSSTNTAAGTYALYSTTAGSGNTAFGKSALYTNTTGSNNTALGKNADVASNNLTNATAIGHNAIVGASNSMALGGTGDDAVKVGIGVTAPTNELDVNGLIRMRTGAGNGYIAASNADGVMTWTDPYSINTGVYSSNVAVNTEGSFDAATNGWNNVTGASLTAPGPGQYIVFVSMRCKIQGGSGVDNADFRLRAFSGCSGDVTASTGLIETLDDVRNNYGLITFQRALTLTGNCSYTIQLQIEMSSTDDSVYYNNVNLSYLRVE